MQAFDGLTAFASVLALLASLLFCFHSCFYGWASLLLLVAVATAVAYVPAVTGIPAVALTSSFVVGQAPLLASGIWHPVSLLHVDGFSTVVDFPTDSGCPAVIDVPNVNVSLL